MRQSCVYVIGCEEHIASADAELKIVSAQLEKWMNFRVSCQLQYVVVVFSWFNWLAWSG